MKREMEERSVNEAQDRQQIRVLISRVNKDATTFNPIRRSLAPCMCARLSRCPPQAATVLDIHVNVYARKYCLLATTAGIGKSKEAAAKSLLQGSLRTHLFQKKTPSRHVKTRLETV